MHIESVFATYSNGLKKNQPKSALLCHKTYDIWCNIVTRFQGSFDVKHVSLDMCYTLSIQFRYENNIDTTYKLLVVFHIVVLFYLLCFICSVFVLFLFYLFLFCLFVLFVFFIIVSLYFCFICICFDLILI